MGSRKQILNFSDFVKNMTLLISLLLIILTLFLYWCLEIYKKNKILKKIPGPSTIPFIGYKLPTDTYGVVYMVKDCFEKYGKSFKVYIGDKLYVMTCDADLIEDLMKSNIYIWKSKAYDLFGPWLRQGLITTSHGAKWKQRRKYLTPSFHFAVLKQFFPIFKENTRILIQKLGEEADKGKEVDVHEYASKFSLDIIAESSLGVKLHFQEGKNSEYINAAKRFTEILIIRNFSFWKRFYLPFRLFAKEYNEYKSTLNILNSTSRKIITEKRKEYIENNCKEIVDDYDCDYKKKSILIDALMHHSDLNNDDIEEEVNNFMFAGHDTTSAALSFAMYELSKHPKIQEKLYNEVNGCIDNDENNFTQANIQKMKYLDQVLKEVLRLRSPVPFIERELREDAILGDTFFPKGTTVSMVIYCIQRHKDYYLDPETFDPERFNPDISGKQPTFAYVPFSAGPRNCIGQKYAILEMKTALASIILNFKLHPVDGHLMEVGMGTILRSKYGFPVKFERRKQELTSFQK